MENEKNKDLTHDDITNKNNIVESESNHNFSDKTSDDFHSMHNRKIKLNEEKINSESQKNINDENKYRNNDIIIEKQSYYDKINRYLRFRRKKVILIILLSISSIFLIISIYDFSNSNKIIYGTKNILINNIIIFSFQMIYICSLFIFQILTLTSRHKDNFRINLIFLLIICVLIIMKTILFMNKKNKNSNLVLNLLISFFFFIINLVILLITLRIIRMRKSEKQNIEEIINFTDIPQGTTKIKINDKKDNQIAFNISGVETKPEKKEGRISNLVEEENNKNDVDNTDEQK